MAKFETVYRDEVATEILRRLSAGEPLIEICRTDGMPAESTVRLWADDNREGFAAKYARARESQAHALAEQLIAIADDGRNDWMAANDPDNPGYKANGEHIQRSRLRYDARKWLTSKILPKVYGDRTTIAGDAESPLAVTIEDNRPPITDLISATSRP
jgi:hypothetical protein